MSGKQAAAPAKPGYDTQKITDTFGKLVVFLIFLAIAAGGLHFAAASKEKEMIKASSAAYEQFALTQHISMLTLLYIRREEGDVLTALQGASSEGFSKQVYIAPPIRARMMANGLDEIVSRYFEDCFHFISQKMSNDGRATATRIITAAREKMPPLWHETLQGYIASEQKIVDILTYVCYALYVLMAGIVAYASSSLFKPAMAQIDKQRENLERLVATDLLTGIYNRTMLFKVASVLISGSQRHKQDLTALAIDIDNCQAINDAHGRVAGDQAIKAVAKALGETLRTSDVIGRVGGEEFAVFLSSTDEYRAELAAEKLRAAVEAMPFSVKDTVVLMTVSIGIAQMQPIHKLPDDILRDAQAALRKAKDMGRNRVVCYSKMDEEVEPQAQAGTVPAQA